MDKELLDAVANAFDAETAGKLQGFMTDHGSGLVIYLFFGVFFGKTICSVGSFFLIKVQVSLEHVGSDQFRF